MRLIIGKKTRGPVIRFHNFAIGDRQAMIIIIFISIEFETVMVEKWLS